jgi:Rod binding domain-containing protein
MMAQASNSYSQGAFDGATAAAAEQAKRNQIRNTAEEFEATFIAQMLKPMFDSLNTDGPMGGGFGETMYRSMLTDQLGKSVSANGGIGLADTVQREMLKLQGLT